jgi:hypothetical protein
MQRALGGFDAIAIAGHPLRGGWRDVGFRGPGLPGGFGRFEQRHDKNEE